MNSSYELLVIGAGPAGMAAAQAAARNGVKVALVDEQAEPGGQIYRNVDASPLTDAGLLGRDYLFGKPLVQAFRHAHIDYFANSSVWFLGKGGELGVIHQGSHRRITARRVIIAAGAQERPMPFPGWQLPGVMNAGAGQILLKSAALVPQQPPVLAGSGPLLLLLAWQYLRAGVGVRALVDTTPTSNRLRALRYLPRALAGSDYLFKGLKLLLSIRHARVPWYKRATGLRAEGDERLQRVTFSANGKLQTIESNLLLLHQGVIPALHIAEAAGCQMHWNDAQQCWQPLVDSWGESSQAGIFVVGDGAGVAGARAANLGGQLAGLQVAHQLGQLAQAQLDRLARPLRNARDRHLAVRPFLDAYYRVGDDALAPAENCVICRCEEVDAAQLRTLVELGCSGPNQAKAFVRCGMGPCQGRFCAATVEHVFARERGTSVGEIGRFRARPPLTPVTLGQLAAGDGESI